MKKMNRIVFGVIGTLVLSLITGCAVKRPLTIDQYPAKQGSLREMTYSPEKTTFSLWSPGADAVTLRLYASDESTEVLKKVKMKHRADGSWTATVWGDQKGKFYTFQVTQASSRWKMQENPGIFATAVGLNGKRAAIIDLSETNPEGWEQDAFHSRIPEKDAIIYELHMRDFSVHPASGIKNKGKFLSLTEHGTLSPEGLKTGIDHLVELGVTHVQILPMYDYASVDESQPSKPQYNWGYDPLNYNVPEGSYSTNAADPLCRIREMKMMIKALHDAGISVIMDVVYNHTFDVENSRFTQTCPDYFYRMNKKGELGNASGCGNETASERVMMHRFIVESAMYWVDEYHIDGFRFDLMGIHDQSTMMDVRRKLDARGANYLLYGEGWAAGAPLYDNNKLAMKANVKQMPGVGAFCDDLRDALRGPFSDDRESAFLDAKPGMEQSIRFGLVGCMAHPDVNMQEVNYSKEPWTVLPTQSINYVSCHDDMMLTDRLKASIALQEGEMERLDKLAQTAILTSQGLPFLWAGEEILRDKKGVHNSYCSPDSINQIDWTLKAQNQDLYQYYRGLIQLRKAHPAFRIGMPEEVRQHMRFLETGDNIVAFVLKDHAGGDEWEDIVVILNSRREAAEVMLPKGKWVTYAADGKCPCEPENKSGIITVSPQSAMILHTR